MNLNKKRFKHNDSKISAVPLHVLGNCLYYFSVVSAPFAPFISESIYQKLRDVRCPSHNEQSIHYHQIPTTHDGCVVWNSNGQLLKLFDYVSDIFELTRIMRSNRENSR